MKSRLPPWTVPPCSCHGSLAHAGEMPDYVGDSTTSRLATGVTKPQRTLYASRVSEEISPMPQPKLWLIARRLVHTLDKISCDFATRSSPSSLAALRHEEAHIGRLGLCYEGKYMSMIGDIDWRKFGHSTCPSRGASDLRLGSGVPYAVLHGVKRHQVGGGPTRITGLSRFLRHNLAKAESVLEKLDRVGTSHICGQQLLAPHLLGKSGEAWGTTLMAWLSRWNRVRR